MYRVLKFQAPFERLKQYVAIPEIRLYKSIITQAIIDATNTSSDPEAKALERDAKNWIFGNEEHFQMISYLSNSEPTFIIKLTKEAIKLNQKKLGLKRGLIDSKKTRKGLREAI